MNQCSSYKDGNKAVLSDTVWVLDQIVSRLLSYMAQCFPFSLSQFEQGVSLATSKGLMQNGMFPSLATWSLEPTHWLTSRSMGTYWKRPQHHTTLSRQGTDHPSAQMTETLIQLLSRALAEGQLQPAILWVGKARSVKVKWFASIAQLICCHQFYLTSESTLLSIPGKALEGAESWRCTRDQGEQTKPEPGPEPTTPLLVSVTGPLEPLSTGEL